MTNSISLAAVKEDIKSIDEQHILLKNLVKDIIKSISNKKEKNDLNKLLQELLCYMSYHFRIREDLLIRSKHPDFSLHRKRHDDMFKKIIWYHDKYKKGTPNIEIEIGNYLKEWTMDYINKSNIE